MASLDFDKIRRFFDFTKENSDRLHIDDTTAADLHLHKVYEKINRTFTSPGRAYLYYLLRTQCQNRKEYDDRRLGIDSFNAKSKQKLVIVKQLKKLGFQSSGNVTIDLWQFKNIKQTKHLSLLRFWIGFTLCAILSSFLFGPHIAIFIAVPFFIINLIIHAKSKPGFAPYIPSLIYLFKILNCANALTHHRDLKKLPEIEELSGLMSTVEPLRKKGPVFQPLMNAGGDIMSLLIEYLRIFFLLDLHTFLVSYHKIGQYQTELKNIYTIIGRIDAYQSAAAFSRAGDVRETTCSSELRGIAFADLKHPLLENCIGNSLEAKRDIILTGTNMSGKSTFLRTLGINQVLATSLGFAFAERYDTGFFFVVSSISTVDEVLQGKSRYFIEAERLLELLNVSKEHNRGFLFLVDEILSGTNSADRIPASISILKKLGEGRSIAIAATHDLDIAEELQNVYDNYHFSERISEEQLHFDYLLKPGIVNHRNAIKILKFLGYPDEVIPGE